MFWGQYLIKDQNGEQRVSTGISPSGEIHVGNLREILTGDIIYKSILKTGRESTFIYLADDIDPLRKVYPFLPQTYSEHVGKPLRDIPAPKGEGKYSEYFLKPFIGAMEKLDIKPKIIRSGDLYRDGKFGELTTEVIRKKEKIKEILERLSGRELENDWFPYNPKCSKCGRINSTKVTGNSENVVNYTCSCGNEGESDVFKEDGKLPWRIEWPAKWKILNVTVEPFGKDHGTVGGSYDTGKEISEKIFNYTAPIPLIYERILLKGKGAMHSSTGINIPAGEILTFAPPEIVRYIMARVPPTRHIDFDPEAGFLNTMDEFERLLKLRNDGKISDDQSWILDMSMAGRSYEALPDYRHITTLVQIYESDQRIKEILASERKVYPEHILMETINLARRWIQAYAPKSVKFKILGKSDPVELNEKERILLCELWAGIRDMEEMDPDKIHQLSRKVIEKTGIPLSEGFKCIYKALIGKESGPRLGYFLSVAPRDKIRERMEAICNE